MHHAMRVMLHVINELDAKITSTLGLRVKIHERRMVTDKFVEYMHTS